MRVSKVLVGSALLALVLTGCSTNTANDRPAAGDDKPTQTTQAPESTEGTEEEGSDGPTGDCIALAEGVVVNGKDLDACVKQAMEDTAGYAAEMDLMGMTTTSRANPAEGEYETISDFGSMIVIDGEAWVKTDGDWIVADPDSDDIMISSLSESALEIAQNGTDTEALAGGSYTGDLTVTGTEKMLGETVYVLEGTMDIEGAQYATTIKLTKDYVLFASDTLGEINGMELTVVLEMTEWNKKQDIVAPL